MEWKDSREHSPSQKGEVKVLMYTSPDFITEETVYFDGEIYLSENGTTHEISGFVVCVKM